MLAELDVVVFLKSHDDLGRMAERVFGVLKSGFTRVEPNDEMGAVHFTASGLGFDAVLYENTEDMLDPEFEEYQYGLEITSRFWCVELDTLDLEGPLSEYFARFLAFALDAETATEILLETTEEGETFEIRSYRRNPQYRLDQSPTTPKVFVVETREVVEPFGEQWDEEEDEEYAVGEVEDGSE